MQDLEHAIVRFTSARPPVKKDPTLLGGERVEQQLKLWNLEHYRLALTLTLTLGLTLTPTPTLYLQRRLRAGGLPRPHRPVRAR